MLFYAGRMKRTSLAEMTCSIARTMDVIGEWWTPLILRDLFGGITRFEDLRRDLGIATNVLTDRLGTLVDAGVLERVPTGSGSTRTEYALTDKGRDLYPVIVAVMAWGDRWMAGEQGPPARVVHHGCGHDASPTVVCGHCGEPLSDANSTAYAGPGGRTGAGTMLFGPILAARGDPEG
jgi:DNA-binding HxlR family transcriptional regulator